MEFVRAVRQQYLWVDFLCLAHGTDDGVTEMRHMDKIYAGAQFAMIAAYETGLYGNESQIPQTRLKNDQRLPTRPAVLETVPYADDPVVYNY